LLGQTPPTNLSVMLSQFSADLAKPEARLFDEREIAFKNMGLGIPSKGATLA
jgi:hypothetical protein